MSLDVITLGAAKKYTDEQIEKSVSGGVDLSGYYTREEIDAMDYNLKNNLEKQISAIPKFAVQPVETLPTENISETTVYLVRDTETEGNLYTEYIYVNEAWECLGSQSVDIDLSNYYTKQEIDEKGFITTEDLPEIPESDFSQFIEQTASSANLYPPMTEGWTNNATLKSDGSENPNASGAYCITPPIPVSPNTTYTVKPVPWGGLTDANRGRAYNENGMALAKLVWVENADGTVSFTTPENASYIRFTVYKTNFDNSNSSITDIDVIIPIFNSVFMLVKGTTAPEKYEAYGEGKYRLKDIEIPEKSVELSKVDDETLPIFAPLAGKKIVNFGDSIFGNARPPEDVSTFLAKKTGAEVLNCAFGGCRMSVHAGHWDAFSMYRLAYSIANNDFALQDEAINHDDRTSYAEEPLALIKATDFSNVDIVTIGYGTNDFTGNNTLDNSENPLDTSTVGGALRYSIETLLTAYPNLRIVILSLTYRFWVDDNNTYTEDSNSRTNSKGDTVIGYNTKLKEVAEEYNLPFIDNYNIGIGKFNRYQYFPVADGTHHNETGRKFIASHLAGALTSCSSDGKNGSDGYTPVKGVDYFTDEDKAEIIEEVAASLSSDEEKTITYEVKPGGYYNLNGVWDEASTVYAKVTNLIPVSTGEKFLYTGRGEYQVASVLWYDSAKIFISSEQYSGETPGTNATVTVEAPSGVAYVMFQSHDYDSDIVLQVSFIDEKTSSSVLFSKKIVYDGDSICESRTSGAAANGGAYAKIIAEITGGNYVNQAVSGGKLTTRTDSGHSVVDNLANLPTDGDLYCFEGGINDYWSANVQLGTYNIADFTGELDTTTVCGALETIFRYAINNFVGKPICFVITHKIQRTAYVANDNGKTFKDFRDAMVAICEKYSIPYYDAFSESGLNGWNTAQNNSYLTANSNGTADGCHPNEEGYKRYYVPQLISLFERIMPVE